MIKSESILFKFYADVADDCVTEFGEFGSIRGGKGVIDVPLERLGEFLCVPIVLRFLKTRWLSVIDPFDTFENIPGLHALLVDYYEYEPYDRRDWLNKGG